MDNNLRRAAVAVALISGFAGQLLAVSPHSRNGFQADLLARATAGEAPAPVIAALNITDPDGYSVAPLRDKPEPKTPAPGPAVKPTPYIPLESRDAYTLGVSIAPGRPLK